MNESMLTGYILETSTQTEMYLLGRQAFMFPTF